MPDSKGIEPVVVQTFRMEVAGGLAAAALIPSRLCSAADETAKVREIVPAITAADQVAAARKTHLWRDRANCAVVQVPRRRDCARSPRGSRSHSVMPSIYITSRLTFGRSGVTG